MTLHPLPAHLKCEDMATVTVEILLAHLTGEETTIVSVRLPLAQVSMNVSTPTAHVTIPEMRMFHTRRKS